MRLPRIANAKISVLVADSNMMACKLLADGLRRHTQFTVVASVVDTRSLLRAAGETRPDVALISVQLQDGPLAGLAAVHELRLAQPATRIVLLKDRPDLQLVVEAFRSGARGVFSRAESELGDLCRCVQRVHEGQIWANTRQLDYVLHAFTQMPPLRMVDANGANLLSKREEEVAYLVADGLGNREIAAHLNLSEHTIKNHLFRIFDKLGISTRVELVLYTLANPRKAPPRGDNSEEPSLTSSNAKPANGNCIPLLSSGVTGNRRKGEN